MKYDLTSNFLDFRPHVKGIYIYACEANALRWCVYVKEKEELITRSFSVLMPYPKGGKIIWTCVKDHVIEEKEDHKEIGLRGFDYSLFEEKEGEEKQEGLDGSPYLKHLIKLWPGDWEKQTEK